MRIFSKELIVAMVLGFLVGLIVTYGIWKANQAIKQKENSISPIPTDSVKKDLGLEEPAATNQNDDKLIVAQPDPYTLSNQVALTVSGLTMPNSSVLIFGEKDWELVLANDQGQFATQIQLIKGVNFIKVTAVSDNGHQLDAERTVVYSTTEI